MYKLGEAMGGGTDNVGARWGVSRNLTLRQSCQRPFFMYWEHGLGQLSKSQLALEV